MAWTEDRIAILKAGWEGGLTASQIAERLGEGVTRNAVIGKAHRLGLEARPSPVKASEESAAAPAAAPPAAAPPAAAPAPPPAPDVAVSPSSAAIAKPAARPARKASKVARVTLLDLSEKICKWPIGHPGEPDFHFCGKPVNPGFPYCIEHCALAYQAQLPRRDRDRRPPPFMPGMGNR
jgi:GcrA cell cycle regulator